jgi:hypothetical protein
MNAETLLYTVISHYFCSAHAHLFRHEYGIQIYFCHVFDFYGSMHCKNIPIYIQQDATFTVYFIWKLLYMFQVVPPPIIRSV